MADRPPGPKGEPLFGNSRQYSRDPLEFVTACERAYGGVARVGFGPQEVYLLSDPDHVERVLVRDADRYRKPDFQSDALGDLLGEGLLLSEGSTWERQRELATPAFAPDRVGRLDDRILAHADRMLDRWEPGETRDLEIEMTGVTLRVIADLMLGVQLSDAEVETVRESLEPLGSRFEPDPLRFALPNWLPAPDGREYRDALDTLEGVLDDLVARRRRKGVHSDGEGEPMDLLSILLRARERGEQTRAQLRDEMMTMLLAGHDTTALTLTYTWHLLSEHSEIRDRLYRDLDDIEGPPSAAAVRGCSRLDRVLNEAMRLYPPVYALFRTPIEPDAFDGYRVPEGASVMLSQWAVHRSARHWEDPETFDPDRFRPERRRDRPAFAFFPFGGGPRICIGKHLALLEAKLIVAAVADRYRLESLAPPELELRPSLTIHPTDGLPVRVRERADRA
jgi:cytochrome P450